MLCLNTTRSAIKQTTKNNNNNNNNNNKTQYEHFTAKSQYLKHLVTTSNYNKKQNTNLLFPLLHIRWDFSLMRLGNKSTQRRNNEAKFKDQSTIFKPNNFKS